MWNRLRGWLNDLSLSDPIERRQGPLLQVILLGLSILSILALALTLTTDNTTGQAKLLNISSLIIGAVVYPVSLALLRRGRFNYAVSLTITWLLLSNTVQLIPKGLNSHWITMFVFAYPI